jgi:hypothetical protein
MIARLDGTMSLATAEIVRRRVSRGPGATTAQRAEAKIRARFPVYAGLPLPVVLSLRPPIDIAADLATRLALGTPTDERTTR